MQKPTIDEEVLKRFGLVSEREVATLLGVTVESLRNRPIDRLPAFFKEGRRRLFRRKPCATSSSATLSQPLDRVMDARRIDARVMLGEDLPVPWPDSSATWGIGMPASSRREIA
jgi:hypothetical protein